jgi:membrane-bound lytic murein transglycosylase B
MIPSARMASGPSRPARGAAPTPLRALLLLAFVAAFGAAAADASTARVRAVRTKAAPALPGYAERAEVRRFIAEMAGEGFDRRELTRWFASARFQPRIVEAMQRPIVAPPKWFEYAPPFLSVARIDAGVAFWSANAAALERAEAEFGVPAEIVVAIVGVETFYGRYTGSHRVIDALSTLAFDYPRRAAFFRGELKEFLRLAREQRISPLAPKGSFAGALGLPQFMPGSYRRFAIDFDGDGRVDLWRSADDAIGSVASYLARHDWLRGQPVLLPATIAPEQRETTLRRLDGGISERRPMTAWLQDGVGSDYAPADLAPDPVGVLALEDDAAQSSYWIACPNFYVITRYNKSRLYAAAVFSLAQQIRAARAQSPR